ncbi:hypothetical protein BH10PLA1_BH10PLA1_00550 [soil metagenome]
MFGFSFSWRRAIGLSAAKARLSRRIGIPLQQAGRDRKVGRMVGAGGFWALLFAASMGRNRSGEATLLGCLGTIVKLVFVAALVALFVMFLRRH